MIQIDTFTAEDMQSGSTAYNEAILSSMYVAHTDNNYELVNSNQIVENYQKLVPETMKFSYLKTKFKINSFQHWMRLDYYYRDAMFKKKIPANCLPELLDGSYLSKHFEQILNVQDFTESLTSLILRFPYFIIDGEQKPKRKIIDIAKNILNMDTPLTVLLIEKSKFMAIRHWNSESS